ncbi:alpha/beta fold hydrolase [Mucilaginibacter sp.]|uniref:alpha/beta fold hydrolase n=1 Tax=Mucilaginibacter sp. TaxID=1882438 RepID=UPI003D1432FA
MEKVKVNGIEINYKITGKGTPVVLIHGHPFDHTMWQPQAVALSAFYQVITPDLRGYGKSSLPENSKTSFEDYATDVLKLLDNLAIDSFHLGGLSMGGQVIMEIYRQAPAKIKSLIFADTFASLDTPAVKKGRYDAATRFENEGMDAYAEEAIYKMLKPEHVTEMPGVAAFVINMMKDTNPAAAAIALRARAERIDYLADVLPQINIPTLIIVGRQDEFTPVVMAEELKASLKNCKLAIIEDAGHMPNLEHPDEFNAIVIDFLESISTGHHSL